MLRQTVSWTVPWALRSRSITVWRGRPDTEVSFTWKIQWYVLQDSCNRKLHLSTYPSTEQYLYNLFALQVSLSPQILVTRLIIFSLILYTMIASSTPQKYSLYLFWDINSALFLSIFRWKMEERWKEMKNRKTKILKFLKEEDKIIGVVRGGEKKKSILLKCG